jgi:hypothetical protein
MKEAGIPISQTCNDAMRAALNPELISARLAGERALLDSTMKSVTEREKLRQKEKEAALQEFIDRVNPRMYNPATKSNTGPFDDAKFIVWAKKTGLSISELRALKGEKVE